MKAAKRYEVVLQNKQDDYAPVVQEAEHISSYIHGADVDIGEWVDVRRDGDIYQTRKIVIKGRGHTGTFELVLFRDRG